jgi:hypothetical protein
MSSSSSKLEYASPQPKGRFVSAHTLAMLTILLLMLSSIIAVAAIVSQIVHLTMNSDTYGPGRYYVALSLQILVFGITAVVFCAWFHRAYRNLAVIQLTTPKLTPVKAVEGFFIPFINFYHPLDVLGQLWAGSSHSGREHSPLVLLWWIGFLCSWLVTLLAAILGLLEVWGPVQQTAWSVVSQVLWLGSCVMGVGMVRGIDLMQKERVEMVADLQSVPAVPIAGQPREPKPATPAR